MKKKAEAELPSLRHFLTVRNKPDIYYGYLLPLGYTIFQFFQKEEAQIRPTIKILLKYRNVGPYQISFISFVGAGPCRIMFKLQVYSGRVSAHNDFITFGGLIFGCNLTIFLPQKEIHFNESGKPQKKTSWDVSISI